MARTPLALHAFALVVVRKGEQFLLVHETKHGQLWYLPAGRVEPGETFEEAAHRETREEAGIAIALDGILRVDWSTSRGDATARMRVVFLARPAGDEPPKCVADDESLEARWVSLAEMEHLPLRGPEVRHLFEDVARGAPVYPLSLFGPEGRPLLRPD